MENKIRIITDSACDITTPPAGLTVLPMTISFGAEAYLDGITLTHKEFYAKLVESDDLPTTSQIAPYAFEEAFRAAAQAGEQVIAITLSSKLSGTYQSAMLAADTCADCAVSVIDSETVCVGQHILVNYALQLVQDGLPASEIAARLEEKKHDIRVIALLDTLEYLMRGGRISRAVGFVGGVLSIKPVIAIQDGEVVVLGKARGSKNSNNLLSEQIRLCGGVDFSMPYELGYTGLSDALLQKYIHDSESLWAEHLDALPFGTVGGTIGTHAGPGAVAVAFFHQ